MVIFLLCLKYCSIILNRDDLVNLNSLRQFFFFLKRKYILLQYKRAGRIAALQRQKTQVSVSPLAVAGPNKDGQAH